MIPTANQSANRDLDDCGYFTSTEGISIRYHRWSPARCHPVGTVILLGGRKEFLEKYIETAGDLNRMGFDVYSFDWRGQGLSSRMLPDTQKGYIGTYEDYLVKGKEAVRHIVESFQHFPLE